MNTTMRIILIDNNLDWLEALAEYLRRRGFSVETASDPARGLDMVDALNAALVVCDYNMPGMNGLEFISRLLRRQRQAAVLMLSSTEEPSLARHALDLGAQAFLPKTISPPLLLQKIRQLMEVFAPSGLNSWQRLLPGTGSTRTSPPRACLSARRGAAKQCLKSQSNQT
jgi:DNA-binding response OmpR family regulator